MPMYFASLTCCNWCPWRIYGYLIGLILLVMVRTWHFCRWNSICHLCSIFQVCLDLAVTILHLTLMSLPSMQWCHLQIILLLLLAKGILSYHRCSTKIGMGPGLSSEEALKWPLPHETSLHLGPLAELCWPGMLVSTSWFCFWFHSNPVFGQLLVTYLVKVSEKSMIRTSVCWPFFIVMRMSVWNSRSCVLQDLWSWKSTWSL